MVSILMPVKNASIFLEECLNSILNQSFQNWELVVVDDHSTDNSFEILEGYQSKDQRIQVLKNNGNGIIEALSLAYEHSKGDFITRMDADDIMVEDKIEKLYAAIQQHPHSVATAKVKYFNAEGIGEGYAKYEQWLNELVDNESHYDNIYKECVIPSPCWMTTRSILNEIGGFEQLNYPEDYDLCFKFYKLKIPVTSVPLVLHHWRDYSSRTSRTDPNYADNTFLDLKIQYFLKCDYRKSDILSIWGAGKKGKYIANKLSKLGINFNWYTNNPNKIGHTVYDTTLLSTALMTEIKKGQIIMAIAENSIEEEKANLAETNQVYSFC